MKLQLAMIEDSAAADELKSDVSEMEKMVEEYISFSRGEGSETVVEKDLREILEDLVNRVSNNSIEITLRMTGNLCVPLRPNAFRRCMTNLINNAIIYGGNADIQASQFGDMIKIFVDDSGPGIPVDQRTEVFKPFYRLDSARGPDQAGSGLGLTIARDVMHGLGGDLVIEESPEGGTRVRLHLPV